MPKPSGGVAHREPPSAMNQPADVPASSAIWNLPNRLTISRLGLAIVLFGVLAYRGYALGAVLFIVAASTDWLDGHFARKYGLVTQLGRILDPFVDKIIVCGTFVFLAAVPRSEIAPWMTVVIVGRELLVTALRSFLEQRGADFSAEMSGKLKMVFQCVAAGASLIYLAGTEGVADEPAPFFSLVRQVLVPSVWIAVGLTVYSGWEYVRKAWGLLR